MSASLPFTVMPCPCCGSMKIAISTTTNALTNLPRNDRPVCLECGVRAETLEAWNKRTARPEELHRHGPSSALAVELKVLKEVSDDLSLHGHGLAAARIERKIHLLSVESPQLRSQEKT